MEISLQWVRVRRFLIAIGLGLLIALALVDFLDLGRRWAVPAGLFVAVQLQKNNLI